MGATTSIQTIIEDYDSLMIESKEISDQIYEINDKIKEFNKKNLISDHIDSYMQTYSMHIYQKQKELEHREIAKTKLPTLMKEEDKDHIIDMNIEKIKLFLLYKKLKNELEDMKKSKKCLCRIKFFGK